jgi:undecaprenyl diphosphate synthase
MPQKAMRIINNNSIPQHIAIIMDGNGRWAKKRNLDRVEGHRAGVKTVKKIVRASVKLGIKVLTLFAFSKENWNRPKDEVTALMELLKYYLKSDIQELMENNIKVRIIGDINDLPPDIQESLKEVVEKTSRNTGMNLVFALSYGGRAEIVNAVKKILDDSRNGLMSAENFCPDVFERYLYTSGLPDPDLLIRTSGEYRVSNFLLYQIAYTEIYVTKKLWPDFTKKDLIQAIHDYQRRERRFGMTSDQIRIDNGRKVER